MIKVYENARKFIVDLGNGFVIPITRINGEGCKFVVIYIKNNGQGFLTSAKRFEYLEEINESILVWDDVNGYVKG